MVHFVISSLLSAAQAADPIPLSEGVALSVGAVTDDPVDLLAGDFQVPTPEVGLAYTARFFPQQNVSFFNAVEVGVIYYGGAARGSGLRLLAGSGYPQLYVVYGVQLLDGSLGGDPDLSTVQALTSVRVGPAPAQLAFSYALGWSSRQGSLQASKEYAQAATLGTSLVITGLGRPRY